MDKRYEKLFAGVDKLRTEELEKLRWKLQQDIPMVFDDFNYDPDTGNW
jgi:hypothetical protein